MVAKIVRLGEPCVICFKAFDEFGNNAEPVTHGRCCNECNDRFVIPARIRAMRETRLEDELK